MSPRQTTHGHPNRYSSRSIRRTIRNSWVYRIVGNGAYSPPLLLPVHGTRRRSVRFLLPTGQSCTKNTDSTFHCCSTRSAAARRSGTSGGRVRSKTTQSRPTSYSPPLPPGRLARCNPTHTLLLHSRRRSPEKRNTEPPLVPPSFRQFPRMPINGSPCQRCWSVRCVQGSTMLIGRFLDDLDRGPAHDGSCRI